MGSLTSLLLRTLFDTQVTVNNVVVKYITPETVATFTCQSITAATATDDWRDLYQVHQRCQHITLCCCYINAGRHALHLHCMLHKLLTNLFPQQLPEVGWHCDDLQQPQDWLKKVLDVRNMALSLDERLPAGVAPASQVPLLRTPALQV